MTNLRDRARRGDNLADLTIVDVHAHLGPFGYTIPDLTPAGLVEVMDRVGVARMIVSHTGCFGPGAAAGNRVVRDAMRAFPGRILGYASLWPSSADDVRREAEQCLREGFTGFKLHSANGFPYREAAYTPAYEMAHERRLPMLFHTWGEPAVMDDIQELAKRYPDAAFLTAHSGAANEAAYVRLVKECPNVYLDVAYSMSPRGLVKRFVEAVGAERVVWGSDCYCFSLTQQIGKVLGARVSDADKRKMLGENAARILARIRQ